VRALVVGLGLSVVACNHDPTGGSTDAPKIFHDLCSTCHGERGQPPTAMVVRLGVKDLTAPALRAKITPELVEKQIRNGSENKLMPAFDGLIRDDQIRAVAGWVASPEFLTAP
jgi:mono/diheme cytochrome c family protein